MEQFLELQSHLVQITTNEDKIEIYVPVGDDSNSSVLLLWYPNKPEGWIAALDTAIQFLSGKIGIKKIIKDSPKERILLENKSKNDKEIIQ